MNSKNLIVAAVAIVGATMASAQVGPHLEVRPSSAQPLQVPPGEAEHIAPAPSAATAGGRAATRHADFRRGFEIAAASVSDQPAPPGQRPPAAVRDLARLELAFSARATSAEHRLVVASPTGMRVANGWSGVERYMRIPGTGVYKLTELDLVATKGKFYLSSEAVNASVGEVPAGSKSFVDEEGNTLEEVVWVSGGRFHMLSFLPETLGTAGGGPKARRAPAVTALSIARQLR